MSEDHKPDEKSDETEDPVISFIKKFQIQIKGEKKNTDIQTDEEAEVETTESRREKDTKS